MKKGKKMFSVMLCMGLLALFFHPVVSDCSAAEPVRVKVGAIMPLSGPLTFVGLGLVRGYEIYYEKLNEEGGVTIDGQQYLFDLIKGDDRLDPEAAATAANNLVHNEGVKIVFGTIAETCVQAIYEVTRPAGVLFATANINVPGHPADAHADHPLQFRPIINTNDSQPIILDYLARTYPDAKTVAMIYPDVGFMGPVVDRLTGLFKERGLELLTVRGFDMFASDFVPLHTRVLAKKPDILWCMMSGTSVNQLKTARDMGFKGIYVDDTPTDPDVFIQANGPEYCTDVISTGMDVNSPTKEMIDIIARWNAKYKDPFVSHSLIAWDNAWVTTQAIQKANSLDPEKIVKAVESMSKLGDVQTSHGLGYMSGLKDLGANRRLVRPIPLVRIMNGKKEFQGLFLPPEEK